MVSSKRPALANPPANHPWWWLVRELNRSPAWRARSKLATTFIEFLLDQHVAHGGLQNGDLLALYEQLEGEPWHLHRSYVPIAIAETTGLGLVSVKKGGLRATKEASPTRYRLTFYAGREGGVWTPATNDWRKVTAMQIAALKATLIEMRRIRRGPAASF